MSHLGSYRASLCDIVRVDQWVDQKSALTSVQRKYDGPLTMQWRHFLQLTLGEVVKATLLVKIRAEMVYHMAYHSEIFW